MDDDSEGSRGRRLDPVAGGSGEESEAESASAPPPQREASTSRAGGGDDAFLDAVRGVSDEAAAAPAPAPAPALVVEEAFDQYAPAAAPSTSATTPAAPAALAAAAPPKPPPLGSLSRLASSSVSAAEEEAKAEAKRAADAERRKELVARLEQLSETLKLYEREHDFFYTGLAGFGALVGLVVFVATWIAGLSGSLSLGTDSKSKALQVVVAAAGLVGGMFSTAQRVWSPAVRSQY